MKTEFDGYAGRILEVDLTEAETKQISLDRDMASKYIGGKGFAARVLYDRLPQGADPLDPENIMIFATGPLTGTLAPGSGRCIVSTKSPATGLWLDANCGGSFGPEMKMAGIDAIIIRGKAPSPVMLVVDDEEVHLRDASDLWRKNGRRRSAYRDRCFNHAKENDQEKCQDYVSHVLLHGCFLINFADAVMLEKPPDALLQSVSC